MLCETEKMSARPVIALLVGCLISSGCTEVGGEEPATPQTTTTLVAETTTTEAPLPPVELTTRPGPFQLTIDRAPDGISPGMSIEAATMTGESLFVGEIAANETALLRELPPGAVRVFVRDEEGTRVAEADPVTVAGPARTDLGTTPPTSLLPGLNYLTTRDGTTLSTFVTLPGAAEDGPYPTLVEYSGYSPSRPDGDDPGRLLLPALGYALVQVNVRGTGCSGGSFDAFEPIQSLDGYDVIETVAAQRWSGKVGMYGISYAGIMQLHVASTRPPSLSAIAPLSVLDDVASVLYPGGIYNSGFGEAWTAQVSRRADAFGQGWERSLVDAGDERCGANQALRVHNPDLVGRIRATPFTDDVTRQRSPIGAVGAIDVPVLLAGAWQDEQTGAGWPALIDRFDNAPLVRVIGYNGLHIDAIGPEVVGAVTEFYDLYLDDPDPGAGIVLSLLLAASLASVFGRPMTIPFNRFDPAQRARLRAEYEAAPPIRVLFEQGADRSNLPVPAFVAAFSSWPPETVEPTAFRFEGRAQPLTLTDRPTDAPRNEVLAGFTTDPDEASLRTASEIESIIGNDPAWSWPVPEPGRAIRAVSPPLAEDLVVVGPASADLWISSDGSDGDIEVTVSHLLADGSETYVQSGWLRLSQRALAPESTVLRPIRTGAEVDVSPLTPDEPVFARVEIPAFAHVFRAGSRLVVTIDTPGASRPQWTFTVDGEPRRLRLHQTDEGASQLVLPVVGGLQVPTPQPRCGTLRGQPCRQP